MERGREGEGNHRRLTIIVASNRHAVGAVVDCWVVNNIVLMVQELKF